MIYSIMHTSEHFYATDMQSAIMLSFWWVSNILITGHVSSLTAFSLLDKNTSILTIHLLNFL